MTPAARLCPADAFSFHGLLAAGDHIVCGQAAAEPLTLTRKLVAQGAAVAPVTLFLGATLSPTFDGGVPAGMRFFSYGTLGHNASLADRGLLEILPERYSRIAPLFRAGTLPADVVLLQLAPGRGGRRPSLGLAHDYCVDAARRARCVVAELNAGVPWTHGAELPPDVRIDHWVQADTGPVVLLPPAAGAVDVAIGKHVAGIVPDGATLQAGIGSLPDAVFRQLRGHRHLGLHSGVFGDAAALLMQAGALTNTRKGIDAGTSVTNTVVGSTDLYRWVDDNPGVQVRPGNYTHAAEVIARIHCLYAINGALQVDLTGQVNSEAVGGRQRGGIGGLLDFCHAARQSDSGGRAITVLPATAHGGRQSRIVVDLDGPATVGRGDVDVVVTEFGVADLRHATLEQRAERLIAIAAPAFRETLRHAWRKSTWGYRAWH
ncbi:MAG: 4-hydroxybutyrate-CoA transferase/hydrolase [Ramlibacter sp.]|jgi:acyl-CoA hydrolase|nr:4-hydroxybutyrate-CoA transferase/hydrolase [Ramlibacter sp.]